MINEDIDNDNASVGNDVGNSNNGPHWDNDSASEGYGGGGGDLTPVPPPPSQRRSSSILMTSPDAAGVPPPPMTQQKVPNNKLTRRASTRLTAASMEALTSGMSGMPNMPGISMLPTIPSTANLLRGQSGNMSSAAISKVKCF